MPVTAWPFIAFDSAGTAFVEGTRTKVVEVAMDHLANGWDADEIHEEHPHLALPQIHAALGYYFEHRDELDRLMAEQLREVDRLREEHRESPAQRKLRRAKRGI